MPRHDRQYLLNESKRNDVLELWEVEQYGRDSFDDPDYVSIYGMRPKEWYARGVRILARTAVECTRDRLADLIGRDIASLVAKTPPARFVVVDPFAGSANTLYWITRHVNASTAIGCELDDRVFETTRQNLELVGFDVSLFHECYETSLRAATFAADDLLVVFVAPPWGDALSPQLGLDLRKTTPPVADVVAFVRKTFTRQKIVVALQLYETVVGESLREVELLCDWTTRTTYDIDQAGRNHGLLLGAIGWIPTG